MFRDFPTFSRICVFFLLTLSLLLFSLLIFSLPSASALLSFSSVHIVGSLTSKLPSIIVFFGLGLWMFEKTHVTQSTVGGKPSDESGFGAALQLPVRVGVGVYAHAESMSLFKSDLRFYSYRRIVVISMRWLGPSFFVPMKYPISVHLHSDLGRGTSSG